MIRRKHGILLIVFLIISILIGWLFVIRYRTYDPDSIQKQFDSMSIDIDTDELKKAGYIDVTTPHPVENKKITRFLDAAQRNQKATLKTYQEQDGDLVVKVFLYDPSGGLIRLWTYLPRKEIGLDPDKRFTTKYNVLEYDDIKTIELTHVQSHPYPNNEFTPQNESLYSYLSSESS